VAAAVGFECAELVVQQRARLEQQPADQRALAVVHAAAGDEAQQAARFVLGQVGGDRRARIVDARHQK